MLIRLDPTRSEPLYTQLVDAVRAALVRGDIDPGERLPAARDLAGSLGVNMHTVLRAYNELRDEGVIELRRGRGAVVTDRPPRSVDVEDAVRRLLDAGRRHGLTLPQLHEALDEGARS